MKRKWKLILGLLISYSTIQADIVFFQNGKVLENVRTKIKRDSVSILLPNDKSENYPKTAIKRIQLRPVQLTPIKTEADKLAYEREKIRVAEALQESADWEPLESEKLKVAVLNLQAGKGVEEGEVETIDELISINLVKTKLFSVIDRRSVDRTLSSKGDASCKSVKECDPKKIAELIGAAKVVTGIVTKVKGKYFINGNIVNAKTNTIDFAESSLAESPTKFQEASEYFAKKVAGGILVIYDANVTS
ncbi:MAG: hypothetical protein SFU98_02875, partial [Leptospiraceae bacterium]|nr:hypothetical protein [Leptospiraceae bacterium]